MKKIFYVFPIFLCSCHVSPVKPDDRVLGPDIAELNSYRNSASARCSGSSYEFSLGRNVVLSAKTQAEVSENLLSKGFGTGSLDIGITLQDKSELANLLGKFTQTQVEDFLKLYASCMEKEMVHFYQTKGKGMSYPEKPETNAVVWSSQILAAENTKVANRTERSGNWRSYEVCVGIPDNALMLKDTVQTEIVSGVAAGSWGNWRDDIQFVNNNSYGPTKVCRGFDHQIHDQDRILKMSVKYKLPK